LRLKGEKLPDESLSITVKLGMKDPEDQKKYEDPKSGILTLRNIDPKVPIKLEGMEARMVFNWTEISVKPIPEDPEDPWPDDDPRPDYPFIGTYPDKDKGEEGIDLSGIPKGLGFYVPEEGDENGESVSAYLYITLTRQVFENDAWVDDPDRPGGEGQAPYGWGDNLKVNLPSLDFHARYGDNKDDVSENLFAYNPNEERGISDWALSRPIDLEDPECVDQAFITADENPDNPFKIYSGPTLPEMDKAIPIGNMAKVFNENLIGEKDLYFDYTVKLSSIPDEGSESLKEASGEIILYPDMLKKRVQASVDMLIVVPLIFKALQTDPDPAVPVVVTIAPDLGDDDLFGRKSSDDNEYFDMVKSLGFDINIKNLAGLSAGRFFLENQTGEESSRYRTSAPIIDFSKPQNKFSLGGEELETIKAIWPFVPQLSIEFEPGEEVRIERNFNIELQSITIKAGGEYTFETGW
jgi:hypothetical protein